MREQAMQNTPNVALPALFMGIKGCNTSWTSNISFVKQSRIQNSFLIDAIKNLSNSRPAMPCIPLWSTPARLKASTPLKAVRVYRISVLSLCLKNGRVQQGSNREAPTDDERPLCLIVIHGHVDESSGVVPRCRQDEA
jgi:hypothetical protein